MISICVIEDEKGQYDNIRDCLVNINEQIRNDIRYSHLEFEIIDIQCWKMTPNDFKSHFISLEVDIIFLDHELEWNNRESIWNGDKVLAFIKANIPNVEMPYIVYTSDKVEEKSTEARKVFSLFKRKPGEKQILHDSIGKAYFMDNLVFGDLKTMIIEKLQFVFSKNAHAKFPYYSYPESDSFSEWRHFRWDKRNTIKKDNARVLANQGELHPPTRFYKNDIVTFFVGAKDLYCVLHIMDEEVNLAMIKVKSEITKTEFIKLLSKTGISTFVPANGIIYNPDYISVDKKSISLSNKKLSVTKRNKIKKLLKEKLKESYQKNSKNQYSKRDGINDINPFATTFEKFFDTYEIDDLGN